MRKLLIGFILVITFIAAWYGESRNFFCIDNGTCVTVWKTYNNTCYIIPYKYYGIVAPTENYIRSTNTDNLTLFFTKKLPNAIIFQSQQSLQVVNTRKDKVTFYDYNNYTDRFKQFLYSPDAKNFNDLREDAGLVDIDVRENYAKDKTGKKL